MGSFEQAEKKFRDWRGKLIERLRRENLPERDIEVSISRCLRERGEASPSRRIAFAEPHQHADPRHADGLLRPRRHAPL